LNSLYTSFYGKIGNKQNNNGFQIPRSSVRTNPLLAAIHYGYNPFSELRAHELFGDWASRYVDNEDIVVTWGLAALPIIQKARDRNIISIVERGSAHAATQRDLLIEEYELYGQPVDALQRSFSPARMERELMEYELADYIEVPSEFAKRSFIEQGIAESKLIKVFLGVDLRHFKELPKSDNTFRVIYTGQMSLQKGVHYLLQAFAELKLPGAELWLFGAKLPELDPFFDRYQGCYRYFGTIPYYDLHQFYAQGSVFAICSIQEGLAQVQPQAMACALPVICTTNTGGEDLITEGVEGFVLPIRNLDAIKEKILYLYENPDICYEMGQQAKNRVRNGLTWDDYGKFIFETYQDLSYRNSSS
jgi:glycosyltransferase involved in cell wall biosynthesis